MTPHAGDHHHRGVAQMVRDMMRVRSVQDVHDLHVWSIAGGMPLLTAHVLVGEDCALSGCEEIRAELNEMLKRDYGIAHSTLQFECAGCDPNHLYCDVPPIDDARRGRIAVKGVRPGAL